MRIRTRLFVVVVTLLTAVPGLRAQGPTNVDAEAERLFNVVMSPYCPGPGAGQLPLDDELADLSSCGPLTGQP